MSRIAHISDVHLLEPAPQRRRGLERFRLGLLNVGRPVDPEPRRRRLRESVTAALRLGADHIVLTGDLTDDGMDGQFEVLAETLSETACEPERLTLVPGNHDAYHDGRAWERALAGPLRGYRPTSARGSLTVLPGAVIAPVSTAIHQPFTHAAGLADRHDLAKVDRVARDPMTRRRAVVVAIHHPPAPHPLLVATRLEGLLNYREVRPVLDHRHVHVLHGHTHRERDRAVAPGEEARIFSTRATVDGGGATLRVYDAHDGRLWPAFSCPLPSRLAPIRRHPHVALPTG